MKTANGWIGSTSYAQPQGKGEYPGATCKVFRTISGYNRYFEKNSHLLVINDHYIPYFFGLFTMVIVMMTNQLSPDELEDMQETSREIEFKMADRRKTKTEAREKQAALAVATRDEVNRLADVGRKYEARVKHMRSLDPTTQERKDLEKQINRGDPEILGLTNKQDSAAYNAGHSLLDTVNK